jgi:hypothetical protein
MSLESRKMAVMFGGVCTANRMLRELVVIDVKQELAV